MNSAEYRAAIEALGLNQTTAAAWLGISRRQSAAYAIGESSVPPPTAMLLELCVRLGIRPEDVN
jgi:ABC-type amino acid transport system permease subunit